MRENGWVPVRAQEQSIRTEARRGFQKHVVRFARVEYLQTWEKNQVRPETWTPSGRRRGNVTKAGFAGLLGLDF